MGQRWNQIEIAGVTKIERLAAIFQVWAILHFPYAQMKVYVYEQQDGSYRGEADMATKNPITGLPEWNDGSGQSVEDALRNVIDALFQSIERYNARLEEDFEWRLLGT